MTTEPLRRSRVGLQDWLAVGSLALFTLGLPFVAAAQAREVRWTVVPGVRVGDITVQTAEKDLIRLLGSRNVRRRTLNIGREGDTRPGTVVFPGTANELQLFWTGNAYRVPEYAVINRKQTHWRTPEGITLGTTLEDLVRLNGHHFRLHGLAWDYSGTVDSWDGGSLARYSKRLIVRLGPTVSLDTLSRDEASTVEGSGVIASSTPALASLGLKVYELVVGFGGAEISERDERRRAPNFSIQPSACGRG